METKRENSKESKKDAGKKKKTVIEMKNSFHDFISRLDRTNKESVSLKIRQNQYQIEKQRENENLEGEAIGYSRTVGPLKNV